MEYFYKTFLIKADSETQYELDMSNLKSIYRLSMVVIIVQALSLIVYTISNFKNFFSPDIFRPFIYVSSSIVICAIFFFISRYIYKKEEYIKAHHIRVVLIVFIFSFVVTTWSILVSTDHYRKGEQIITFFTVILCILLFVKLHPVVSTVLIAYTFIGCYVYLNFFIQKGGIQIYNFFMLAALAEMGSVMNYHHTVDAIAQKNDIVSLNHSLEIIASHDALTKLRNRYSLNEMLPQFLNRDICIAMMDINKFKSINDTFGHQTGDEILESVAKILLDHFPENGLFRYGGDEFLIIAEENDLREFDQKLHEINRELSSTYIRGTEISISCQYGMTCANVSSPVEIMECIAQADKILYQHKLKKK